MMDKILAKKDYPKWLAKLASYRIYAPRKKDDVWNYEIITAPDGDRLEDVMTAVPAKGIVFPQREFFFAFAETEDNGTRITEHLPEDDPVVVFGVRPCEGKAVTLTDLVFGGEFEDPYYWKRRNATTLVGLGCAQPPSANCFCLSVGGSPHSKEGLDLLLTDLGEAYFAEILTKKGEKLILAGQKLFTGPKPEDRKKVEKIQAESGKKIRRELSRIDNVPAKLKGMFDSSLWDDESMSCIRCGICTYLCPTCHCFDMNDEVETASPLSGKRVRTWDTCQFPDFTMHSSGHNPRPDKASRLRQRINHKFQYFVEIWQKNQCTGCGRCISLCPVGIDIIKVVEKVRDHGA
jgi:ferredoxin